MVRIPRGIAVCAESIDAAWKGKTALNVVWRNPSMTGMGTGTIEKDLIVRMSEPGVIAKSQGDVKTALASAAKKVEAFFLVPYLAHATMEPYVNCTASVTAERCDVWVPTQNQGGVQAVAAKITGLKQELVFVHTTYLGGGFGRRLSRTSWRRRSRSEGRGKTGEAHLDTRGHPERLLPAGELHEDRAGLDEKCQVTAWFHRSFARSSSPGSSRR